jgi:DMSO/TMAO reductase YedYZ molybdopterin-dependent catalytic subunit
MRFIAIILMIFASLSPAVPAANGQEAASSLTVRGDVQIPGSWSVADIKGRFANEVRTVKFSSGMDKEEHSGTGIPLTSLLLAAGPKTEKVPKHYDLTFLVVIEALDHYRVFFSLAELLPSCGKAQVWLIWEVDGKRLPAQEAPFRLVVSSDQGHDRFIYAVSALTLLDGTKLMNRLAAGQ